MWSLLDELDLNVVWLDGDGEFLQANRLAAQSLGFAGPHELVGRTLLEVFPPPLGQQHLAAVQQVLATGESFRRPDFTVVAGREGWYMISGSRWPYQIQGRPCVLVTTRDVTEEVRCCGQYVEAESDYRDLFSHLLCGVLVLRVVRDASAVPVEFEVLAVNPSGSALLNVAATELVGVGLRSALVGDDQGWWELLADVAASGAAQRREEVVHSLGRCVEATCFVMGPDRVGVTFEDTTERRAAEDQLVTANERLGTILNASPAAICVTDAGGVVQVWSAAAERMFGYSAAEVLGHLPPVLDAQRHDRHRALVRLTVEGRSPQQIATWARDRAGRRLDLVVTTAPLCLGGEAVGAVMAIEDVSGDVQMARDRQQSEDRYRTLAENSRDLIVRFDRELRPTYVNPAVAETLGMPTERFLGRSFGEAHPRTPLTEAAESRLRQVLDTGRSAEFEAELRVPVGSRHLHWWLIPELAADGTVSSILATARDITPLVDAQREREALSEQLRQAAKMESIGHLAGGVAHDFNNLLTTILGYVDMLLGEAAEGSALQDDLSEVRSAALRAADLTGRLLAFSRKQRIEPRPLGLVTTIRELSDMIQRTVGEDIAVLLDLAPALPPVMADRGSVDQALLNLVANSRAAMSSGGRLTIALRHEHVQPGGHVELAAGPYVVLSVTDSGHGIRSEHLDRIFEPFFTTREVGQGTGLGLAMVYGIAKQHGGLATCRSEWGHGATFELWLPATDEELPPDALAAAAAPVAAPRGCETVLLVEDDPGVRSLAERLLLAHGYHVLVAAGPGAALDLDTHYAATIELLLTDVVMPTMSGVELAGILRHHRPELRVLLCSGYATDVLAGQTDALVEPLLAKPFTALELLTAVRQQLDQAPAGRRRD